MIPICYVSSQGRARNTARHIAAPGGRGWDCCHYRRRATRWIGVDFLG